MAAPALPAAPEEFSPEVKASLFGLLGRVRARSIVAAVSGHGSTASIYGPLGTSRRNVALVLYATAEEFSPEVKTSILQLLGRVRARRSSL